MIRIKEDIDKRIINDQGKIKHSFQGENTTIFKLQSKIQQRVLMDEDRKHDDEIYKQDFQEYENTSEFTQTDEFSSYENFPYVKENYENEILLQREINLKEITEIEIPENVYFFILQINRYHDKGKIMTPFVIPSLDKETGNFIDIPFKLKSVVVHQGDNTAYGHYYCVTETALYDDSRVYENKKYYENIIKGENVTHYGSIGTPYLYFFERVF